MNNGQAIKSEAVWYRQSQDPSDVASTYLRMQLLDQYHGQASGIFRYGKDLPSSLTSNSCSEHLAGLMPSQGSELCTVVETMFSYETVFTILGNISHADRLELLTFNALPAALDPYMWAHVYLQQVLDCNIAGNTYSRQGNQMNAQHDDPNIYTSDGPDSNIYGLAPNYGCCTG